MMKTKNRLAVVTAAAALALGTTVFALAQDTAGAQQDQGAATSANSWPCPMDQNMMGQRMGENMMGRGMNWGTTRQDMNSGMMMGQNMMNQNMMGQGMGSGMMQPLARDMTVSDVKRMMNSWLAWQGNSNLKLGKVETKDEYIIAAEIVTTDGSLVQRYEVNRQTGWMRPAQ